MLLLNGWDLPEIEEALLIAIFGFNTLEVLLNDLDLTDFGNKLRSKILRILCLCLAFAILILTYIRSLGLLELNWFVLLRQPSHLFRILSELLNSNLLHSHLPGHLPFFLLVLLKSLLSHSHHLLLLSSSRSLLLHFATLGISWWFADSLSLLLWESTLWTCFLDMKLFGILLGGVLQEVNVV